MSTWLLGLVPLLALACTIAGVLAFDYALKRAGRKTISTAVRELTDRHGIIIPILYVGIWMLVVGISTGSLVIHWWFPEF